VTIYEYIEQLRTDDAKSAYIEGDKAKEIRYMAAAAYRFARIARLIPETPRPLRVLDIGTTPFTLFVKHCFPHYDVWTLDRTDRLKERCAAAGVTLVSCNLDDARLPLDDDFFDLVIFTEVLEHVFAPPTEVLMDVRRILRPSGTLILGVPNIVRLSQRLRVLVGRSPLHDADHQLNRGWMHGHGHLHEYTRREIVSLCKGAGYEILDVRMLSSEGPMDILRGNLKFSLRRLVYDTILVLAPPLRTTIDVVCQKPA
jgi:SAM-dependent methyltransferase